MFDGVANVEDAARGASAVDGTTVRDGTEPPDGPNGELLNPNEMLGVVVAGAGVTDPAGAGELSAVDGDVTVDGDVAIDGVVALDGGVASDPVGVLRLRNGWVVGGAGLGGAGRGKHGLCRVCAAGLGFATG
jgi:hypothetical protein